MSVENVFFIVSVVVDEVRDMRVFVNGSDREIQEGITLSHIIEQFRLKEKSVVVELNQTVVSRQAFKETTLKDSDRVEILHLVGGG